MVSQMVSVPIMKLRIMLPMTPGNVLHSRSRSPSCRCSSVPRSASDVTMMMASSARGSDAAMMLPAMMPMCAMRPALSSQLPRMPTSEKRRSALCQDCSDVSRKTRSCRCDGLCCQRQHSAASGQAASFSSLSDNGLPAWQRQQHADRSHEARFSLHLLLKAAMLTHGNIFRYLSWQKPGASYTPGSV